MLWEGVSNPKNDFGAAAAAEPPAAGRAARIPQGSDEQRLSFC